MAPTAHRSQSLIWCARQTFTHELPHHLIAVHGMYGPTTKLRRALLSLRPERHLHRPILDKALLLMLVGVRQFDQTRFFDGPVDPTMHIEETAGAAAKFQEQRKISAVDHAYGRGCAHDGQCRNGRGAVGNSRCCCGAVTADRVAGGDAGEFSAGQSNGGSLHRV
jgi:hypothetical protein